MHADTNVIKERIKIDCSKAKLIGEFPRVKHQ